VQITSNDISLEVNDQNLILADPVERFGHKPFLITNQIKEKVTSIGLHSPPININPEDLQLGFWYVANNVSFGTGIGIVLIGSLLKEARAAIKITSFLNNFRLSNCNHTNNRRKMR
jgi:putative methanogenesis marker protein 5